MNKKEKQKQKQDRLAQALRDNLKRRKQKPTDTDNIQSPQNTSTDHKNE